MKKTILAIDQGTTGTKVLLMDTDLMVLAEAAVDFPQHFPKPGWVEHQPDEIWASVVEGIKRVFENHDAKNVEAIGITNQRETLCFWDRKTGEPLSNAIVWQDRRTATICDALKDKGTEPFFRERTGLLLDPYFSGTKAAWAIRNWPAVESAAKEGRLAVGTVDSYLVHMLSGGTTHVTEPSNASRTLAFHITEHWWDPQLCSALDIPVSIWPEVRPSVGKFAITRGVPGLPDGIPVTGILGDQQAALLGQACVSPGTAKCTYGTGTFMLLNTGDRAAHSRHRLVTTIAWQLADGKTTYALEGSAFIAGAAVQWVRDGLGLIKESHEIEPLAASVPSSDGVVFVPALTGLGAPHWDASATGMLTGLTRGSTRAHIARAVLEGIAFQNADILTAMQKDVGTPIARLNVDGGASANNLLMQFQADILGVKLNRPRYTHTTSLGAVFAAGLGAGIWSDLREVEKSWQEERAFTPTLDAKGRESELKRWYAAVERVRHIPKG